MSNTTLTSPISLSHGSRTLRVINAVTVGSILKLELDDRRRVTQGLKVSLNCFGQQSGWIVAESHGDSLTLVPSRTEGYSADKFQQH